MATCEHCGGDFEAARASARFCSDACRKAASRERVNVTTTYTDVIAGEPTLVTSTAYRMRPAQGTGKHAGHMIHPHTHPVLDAGAHKGERKPCSGRYWCTDCSEWLSAPPCHGQVPPLLARLQNQEAT
jgi:hypothetical protein